MERIFLTRRNLLTLLSKLDRNRAEPGSSEATLIKNDTHHPTFPCSTRVMVTAVEDEIYYVDRVAGAVHPLDEKAV